MVMRTDKFVERHIGPNEVEVQKMLAKINANSIDELLDQTIPESIRLNEPLNLEREISEFEFSKHIQELGRKNKKFSNFIGLGYHPTITPAVIQRNILENPGWYTAYTPYQAEIAQVVWKHFLIFKQ